MSPNGEPSQEGPAEPDQPRQQLGGWQHSKHTVLLCPGQLSLLGKSCGGGGTQVLAWSPPCPLPIAVCLPQEPLPDHMQGICRGQRTCTEPQVLCRCTGGWPRYVPRQRAIPGRACPAQMSHQLARRQAGVRALPQPGSLSQGKPEYSAAGPCLCLLSAALCPPQVPLPHHTQRLTARCQLSSELCFGLCAGFAPAAASRDSERHEAAKTRQLLEMKNSIP